MIDHLVSYSMTAPVRPRAEVLTITFIMIIHLNIVGAVIGLQSNQVKRTPQDYFSALII